MKYSENFFKSFSLFSSIILTYYYHTDNIQLHDIIKMAKFGINMYVKKNTEMNKSNNMQPVFGHMMFFIKRKVCHILKPTITITNKNIS